LLVYQIIQGSSVVPLDDDDKLYHDIFGSVLHHSVVW